MQVRDIALVLFVLSAVHAKTLHWRDRTLVDAHRVSERAAEQVVVTFRDL